MIDFFINLRPQIKYVQRSQDFLFIYVYLGMMTPGELVDVMAGSSAVRLRSLVLTLWSACVLGGQDLRALTWAQAVPGEYGEAK